MSHAQTQPHPRQLLSGRRDLTDTSEGELSLLCLQHVGHMRMQLLVESQRALDYYSLSDESLYNNRA